MFEETFLAIILGGIIAVLCVVFVESREWDAYKNANHCIAGKVTPGKNYVYYDVNLKMPMTAKEADKVEWHCDNDVIIVR